MVDFVLSLNRPFIFEFNSENGILRLTDLFTTVTKLLVIRVRKTVSSPHQPTSCLLHTVWKRQVKLLNPYLATCNCQAQLSPSFSQLATHPPTHPTGKVLPSLGEYFSSAKISAQATADRVSSPGCKISNSMPLRQWLLEQLLQQ